MQIHYEHVSKELCLIPKVKIILENVLQGEKKTTNKVANSITNNQANNPEEKKFISFTQSPFHEMMITLPSLS